MSETRQTVADITVYPWATPADPSNIRSAVEKGEMNAEQRMAALKGKLIESMKEAGATEAQIEDYGDGLRIKRPTNSQLEAASVLPFVHEPKVYKL